MHPKDQKPDEIDKDTQVCCYQPNLFSGFDTKTLENRVEEDGCIMLLDSTDLMVSSFSTIQLLLKAKFVITDDRTALGKIIETMISNLRRHKSLKFVLKEDNELMEQ